MKHTVFLGIAMAMLCSTAYAESNAPIQLQRKGESLHYQVDLSGLLDETIWRVLEKNGSNIITVEVRLRDKTDTVQMRQHHTIRLNCMRKGTMQLGLNADSLRTFSSRTKVLAALKNTRGTPIQSANFQGERGYLEVIAMVNPYQVYSYPTVEQKLAKKTVQPKTYFDRRLRLRSTALPH